MTTTIKNQKHMDAIVAKITKGGIESITPRTRRLAELQSSRAKGTVRRAVETGVKRHKKRVSKLNKANASHNAKFPKK